MKYSFFWGTVRILSIAFFSSALPSSIFAAQLDWEALPDRERLTIHESESEGRHGNISRIDKQGIIIPFTEVPSGLILEDPKNSTIFGGTQQLGRALVIKTKTPEFGFIVSVQTPSEIVIELYPDKLGSRWKPSSLPPTTEVRPNYGVNASLIPAEDSSKGMAAPAVTWGSMNDPKKISSEQNTPSPTTQPAESQPSSVQTQSSPAPQPVENQPVQPQTQVTQPPAVVSQPAVQTQVPPVPQPVESQPMQPQTQVTPPPAVVSQPAVQTQVPPVPQPVESQPIQPQTHIAPPPPAVVSQPAESQQSSVQTQVPPVPQSQNAGLLPGMAVRTGEASFGGALNDGGFENVRYPTMSENATALPEVSPGVYSNNNQAEPVQSHPNEITKSTTNNAQAATQDEKQGDEEVASKEKDDVKIVYVDEEGKPVSPPLDPAATLIEIRNDISEANYTTALNKVKELLSQHNLSKDQREEALHINAEMAFVVNKDDLENNYPDITETTNKAISFNPKSNRNAAALLRLGYVNLRLKNIPEAEAQFNKLRREYPDDENVPLTYYYWGDYHFSRNELQRAADQFQYILEHYAESPYAREAALGLARAYYKMGYYEPSHAVVEYIEKRWNHYYLDYPPFLNMVGDVSFRLGKLDDALRYYWLYTNLKPKGDEADIILTRIGDIYSMENQPLVARNVYEAAARNFPDKDGGLVAKMRLAEEGINDNPNLGSMFNLFDGPSTQKPVDVYESIIKDHPDSELVPLAELKLAMWYLWQHKYFEALDVASDFVNKFPQHELEPKAKEVALKTFAILAAESSNNGTYTRMRQVWERYPILQEQNEILTPESRIALGTSYWLDGKPDQALNAVEPFFLGNKIPKYSEMALQLVLNIYLKNLNWEAVEEVADRAKLWELTPEADSNLDNALALAKENLGKSEEAHKLWKKLYDAGQLPNDQMAVAAFFLARNAENNQEFDDAYVLGKEALDRFMKEKEKNLGQEDVVKIKSQLASLMSLSESGGKLREALDYSQQYLQYVPENDQEGRAGVLYHMARIYKMQGNDIAWRKSMNQIINSYPSTVQGKAAVRELSTDDLANTAAQFSPTGQL